MPLNNVQFTLGQGNLGTPIPGSDYISGMMFYVSSTSSIPSGFSNGVATEIFSLSQAGNLGISSNYSDEIKATASITISNLGSAGDTLNITVNEPNINSTIKTVSLGTYTQQASDTTTTIFATNLSALINSNNTGYSVVPSGNLLTLSARPGMGIALNTTTALTKTVVGGITASIVQFAGGVASLQAHWHYQISEYFRLQPSGILWVTFNKNPSLWNFNEINSTQLQTNGAIRQFGIYRVSATNSTAMAADLDAIQIIGNTMLSEYCPASVIYAPNLFSVADLSTLPNLRLRSDNFVSCVIAQDGGSQGAWLSLTSGISIPTMGACLGAVSLATVSEDIAWPQKFNISNGTEDETVSFSNGQLWSLVNSTTPNLLTQLDNYGYIFLFKRFNVVGSFFNDSHCAVLITSDYAYIERNRTIDKAIRVSYQGLAPLSNSKIMLNSDGTISYPAISIFKNAINPSLQQMVSDGDLSAFNVLIDPKQNVLSTSTVNVQINLVPEGIARVISVKIGFALSV